MEETLDLTKDKEKVLDLTHDEVEARPNIL